MSNHEFTIGRLSERTGVNIETIRYYEKIALLPKPPRSTGGHRLYGSNETARLRFIRRARELGFSLAEIRSLIGLEDARPTCAEVHALANEHISAIRSRLKDLKKLERRLVSLAQKCSLEPIPECPIIDALSNQN